MSSFEEFARASLPQLLRFAAVLTGERQQGEDVVQDVLLRVSDRWSHIGGLDRPESYVRRMVVNEYISWRRKWARIVPRADVDDGRSSPDPAIGVTERDELAARLRRLPPRQRAVIVLRYYQGFDDREIAEVLGCAIATVRSHASHALATLRIDGVETRPMTVDALRREL